MGRSNTIDNLQRSYKNSKQNDVKIGRDFIAPCLKECIRYRRGTGTVTSSLLHTYVQAWEKFFSKDIKIEILASPQIDNILLQALEKMTDDKEKNRHISEEFIEKFLSEAAGLNKEKMNRDFKEDLLCYLLANEILEIRFALPVKNIHKNKFPSVIIEATHEDIYDNYEARNMYHIKQGYFVFESEGKEDIVAFDGSVNETDTAHSHNQEKCRVFKSWKKHEHLDCKEIIDDVDTDWGDYEDKISSDFYIHKPSKKLLEKIKKESLRNRPHKEDYPTGNGAPPTPPPPLPDNDEIKYRHSKEAVDAFLQAERGIIKMCTGSGKTRVALKIIDKLIEEGKIDQFIITCFGNPLLNQWKNIFKNKEDEARKILDHNFVYFEDKKGRARFLMNPEKSGLLTSIDDVHNAINEMAENTLARTIVVYDEVHDLGAKSRIPKIKDKIHKVGYLLGLSATPYSQDEEDEEIQNVEAYVYETNDSKVSKRDEAIKNIFGQKPIYEFTLEDAIKRGILCEFNYTPLDYQLTKEEQKKVQSLQSVIRMLEEKGEDPSEAIFSLARIYKTSESKIIPFQETIKNNQKLWKSTIIFTETYEFAADVAEILQEIPSVNYKVLHNDKTSKYLEHFIDGELDVLVTCKKISQGINIPKLENIILLSVAKSEKDYLQKLGRVLRNPKDEQKIAEVIDFVELKLDNEEDSYDIERFRFLNELSKVKKEE